MKQILTLLICSSNIALSSNLDYQNSKLLINNAPQEIQKSLGTAPKIYEFQSQFSSKSSVSYTGQSFRQVLIEDLKRSMNSFERSGSLESKQDVLNVLNSFYNYNENNSSTSKGVIDGLSEFYVTTKLLSGKSVDTTEGYFYSDIQSPGKNLVKKIAGIDNKLRRGSLKGISNQTTPDAYIKSLFEKYAQNATSGNNFTVPNGSLASQTIKASHITTDGRDLSQLVQKFLHGSVSYSQAARDYLSIDLGETKGLNAQNEKPAKDGVHYTAMEHHFDEAFGYFGAARDFLAYSDEQTRTKGSIDTNNDGLISLKTEKNLGISVNTSRIDFITNSPKTDFSQESMSSFLKGRHLITSKPNNYKKYVRAYGVIALGAWEKTIASAVVHYINKTRKEYSEYGTTQYLFSDFVKYWSEMKGYALAFQFNPHGVMTDQNFDKIHQLMKDSPVLPHGDVTTINNYMSQLLEIRDILQVTYQFSSENVRSL